MNYYNSYTGNRKKKIIRRVTAVLVSVAVILGGTIVFGNWLKKKAESSAKHDFVGIGREDIVPETESSVIIPPSEGGSGSSESVRGLCVPLGTVADGSIETGDEIDDGDSTAVASEDFEARLAMAAEGNTGVLIPLTGDDGFLLYNSLRAGEYSRLPENPTIPDMAELTAAVSSAKAKGLRVSALIRSGMKLSATEDEYDALIAADSRIAADAAEAGFDEIIISSLVFSPEELTGDAVRVIIRYLNQLTAAAGSAEVGLSLPPAVYETATLSPQIEMFVSRSVFLTMELTAEQSSEEQLNYICENLAGTLSVYNMRMLLAPTTSTVGDSLIEKLEAVGHVNYLFTCIPEAEAETIPLETTAESEAVDTAPAVE